MPPCRQCKGAEFRKSLTRGHGEAAGAVLPARPRRPHGPEKRVWRDQDLRQQLPSRWPSECGVTAAAYPTAFDAGRSGRPHHHLKPSLEALRPAPGEPRVSARLLIRIEPLEGVIGEAVLVLY